jgi:hypothetical protein
VTRVRAIVVKKANPVPLVGVAIGFVVARRLARRRS